MYRVFPERIVIETLLEHEGSLELADIAEYSRMAPKEVGQSIRWLLKKKWATKEGKVLTLTKRGTSVAKTGALGPDEELILILATEEDKWFSLDKVLNRWPKE